jgi:predicted small integral membrane protein
MDPGEIDLMLRLVKIALMTAVCLWGALGTVGNILDWEGTRGAMRAVSSMSGWEGGAGDWRATSSPIVTTAGALGVVAFKTLAALLCGLGVFRMWRERTKGSERFGKAKAAALSGCGIAVFGLFLGWIVLGEQWFEMWRSPQLELAGEAAFRYGGFICLIAIFVAMREE